MSEGTIRIYRSILREVRLASRQPRKSRNPLVQTQLREIIATTTTTPQTLEKTLLETRDFLRASRIHTELLKRYNPTKDMTEDERVKASARRVGLQAPGRYTPEGE